MMILEKKKKIGKENDMNKKVVVGIVVVAIVIVLGVTVYFFLSDRSENNNNQTPDNSLNNGNNNTSTDNGNTNVASDSNVLVVYFSAQGHTEEVAQQLATNLNGDVFEIVPRDEYTSDDLDWTDENSRVAREHEDESLRTIELVSTTVDNWENYDTVLIGYPIWWGIAAWPVNTFVENNDFTGKTVIPFCTSASSGLGNSGELLATAAGTGDWQEGHRFSSNPSDSDIKAWTDSLLY